MESELISQEVSTFNNTNSSISYDKNFMKALCTSQIESDQDEIVVDAKSLLNSVKNEDENKKDRKDDVPKLKIEVKHAVLEWDSFQETGDETTDKNEEKRKSIEDFEKLQIVIKSESAVCDANDYHEESGMQTLS